MSRYLVRDLSAQHFPVLLFRTSRLAKTVTTRAAQDKDFIYYDFACIITCKCSGEAPPRSSRGRWSQGYKGARAGEAWPASWSCCCEAGLGAMPPVLPH